jgi:glycosyltransferase involved in cell wall biosynthesis
VSVVLPCLDEAESVGRCVGEALGTFARSHLAGEVIVVDNGSSDGSSAIAEAAGARVVHEPNQGYGNALLTGFESARGEIIVMADADLTYDLTRIPDLVAPIASGEADLVVGSRLESATTATMPWLHRFVGTPILTFLTARACGRKVVRDSQSGFRAFRRADLVKINANSQGMELATEMLIRAARADLRITEIETAYRPRVGESKLSTWTDGWRHLKLILLLAPELVLVGPGAVLLAVGIAMLGLAFARPEGIHIGSLRWQPIFFAGIALVLGVQALLSGMVVAYSSSLAMAGTRKRFAFVGERSFARRCVAVGAAMVIVGFLIEAAVFFSWLRTEQWLQTKTFGVSSLAQSLVLVGSTLAGFGLVCRFLMARAARAHTAHRRDADLRRALHVGADVDQET